jgi:hypothetical protein
MALAPRSTAMSRAWHITEIENSLLVQRARDLRRRLLAKLRQKAITRDSSPNIRGRLVR